MSVEDDPVSVITVSDLHINSTISVVCPVVELDDGGSYHASRGQHWLYECWMDFCEQVGNLPGRKIVVFGGDLGELDTKRRSYQLITGNKATIQKIVMDTIMPLLDKADGVIFLRGTAAHVGKSQWLEEAIANDCINTIKRDKKAPSTWYHFQGVIGGYRFDIAHHASMGVTPANSASKLAERAEVYYYRLGQPLPHFVVRAHNHHYADSGDNYRLKAFFLPSWSLMTEFAYRQGRELQLSDIGGMIFENGMPRLVRYEAREAKQVWSLKI